MKRILLILGLMLTFVACEKDDELGDLFELEDSGLIADNSGYVKLSQSSVIFDREKGGTIAIETEDAAFVKAMRTAVGIEGVGANPNNDWKDFYKRVAPLYIIKYEDIKKQSVYEAFGCKVVRDGYRKFTITVEPNCGSDYDYDFNMIEIAITRIVNTKEYGPIAGGGCSYFTIYLK